MKDISETTALVVDYGSFIGLADCMARKCKKVYYYSPWEQEYVGIERSVIGDGFHTFERCDEPVSPEIIEEVDLWLFPDICYGGFQRYLKSIGKLIWGSMGASDLELIRTKFIRTIKEVGLPVVKSIKVVGVTALSEHLKEVEDKWIKINRYRDNMETWHHINLTYSQRQLEHLAMTFGGMKEKVVFLVQDPINGDQDSPVLEVGYDGWSVDGGFPSQSYQGYELKNKLYLGSQLNNDDLPEPVQFVNEKMSPVLREYGYRNFWATEIRVKDDIPHFTDPTARMAGQTMEHLLNTCTNLPEVILSGSKGELIEPEFSAPFAAEATIHYTAEGDGWKVLTVPEQIQDYVKLYRCCQSDGSYHFPPHKSDELGVICGNGDSVEDAIEDLKAHFELLKNEPVRIDIEGFADLIKEIKEAESEGIEFGDSKLPEPSVILEDK